MPSHQVGRITTWSRFKEQLYDYLFSSHILTWLEHCCLRALYTAVAKYWPTYHIVVIAYSNLSLLDFSYVNSISQWKKSWKPWFLLNIPDLSSGINMFPPEEWSSKWQSAVKKLGSISSGEPWSSWKSQTWIQTSLLSLIRYDCR